MSVTIAYKAPYTSAPSPVQQHYTPHNKVIATVLAGASSDAQAIITHDFNFSAAELALGYPATVTITPDDGNSTTSPWYQASQAPNYTVLGKGTTDVGGKVTVYLEGRPTS